MFVLTLIDDDKRRPGYKYTWWRFWLFTITVPERVVIEDRYVPGTSINVVNAWYDVFYTRQYLVPGTWHLAPLFCLFFLLFLPFFRFRLGHCWFHPVFFLWVLVCCLLVSAATRLAIIYEMYLDTYVRTLISPFYCCLRYTICFSYGVYYLLFCICFSSWGNLPLQSYWSLSCEHGLHCSHVNVRTTITWYLVREVRHILTTRRIRCPIGKVGLPRILLTVAES